MTIDRCRRIIARSGIIGRRYAGQRSACRGDRDGTGIGVYLLGANVRRGWREEQYGDGSPGFSAPRGRCPWMNEKRVWLQRLKRLWVEEKGYDADGRVYCCRNWMEIGWEIVIKLIFAVDFLSDHLV